MSLVSKNINEQIINSIDIVELISEDIELSKKGNNYVGLCPFHSDNNPSFTVSPSKKIYKCFVCDAGGNVITYYQNFHKLSYNETIKQLAKRIGIDVNLGPVIKKSSAHLLLEEISKFYNTTLSVVNEGKVAREYLNARGYEKEDIDYFKLGYAASNLNLMEYLKNLNSDKFSIDEIQNSDLFNQNGSMFFNNRLIIPIMDDESRTIGFSGRTLTEDSIKYLNSRDSQTFKKGEVLYNLNNAKNYLQANEIILVEGFFDVFALRKLGHNNVIAIMGTAFTQNHINLFKKYRIKKFKLCLDGDVAGIQTSIKLGETLIKNGFNDISCVNLKDYKDIDECLASEKDYSLENNLTTFIEYKIKHLQNYFNLETFDGKTKFIDKCLTGIDKTNITFVKLVASSLSNLTGLDIESINEIINHKNQAPINVTPKNNYIPPQMDIPQTYTPVENKSVEIKELSLAPKKQVLLVYMLKSQKNYNEMSLELENQNIDTSEFDQLLEKIKMAYQTLNATNSEEFSLISNKSITFDFFDFLGDKQLYITFNKILKTPVNNELSAHDLVKSLNYKIPGLKILKIRK